MLSATSPIQSEDGGAGLALDIGGALAMSRR